VKTPPPLGRGPTVKKIVPPRPTPLEDFGPLQWAELLAVEDFLVSREPGKSIAIEPGPSPSFDLESIGFIERAEVGKNIVPIITLTDRGWEIASLLRRWRSEGRELADFVAIACPHCSRVRYGDRRPCVCGAASNKA
jgi:hypothetical protein